MISSLQTVSKNLDMKVTEKFWNSYVLLLEVRASQMVLVVKNWPINSGDVRDVRSIPEMGRSPREGNSNPFQCSCLENPTDRGAWWATVHGVTRVGHNLATKSPQPLPYLKYLIMLSFHDITLCKLILYIFSSVQFSRSVVSDSLRPHEPQHARPPCPLPTPKVHPNPCPLYVLLFLKVLEILYVFLHSWHISGHTSHIFTPSVATCRCD